LEWITLWILPKRSQRCRRQVSDPSQAQEDEVGFWALALDGDLTGLL
jgi:hypothetical protein